MHVETGQFAIERCGLSAEFKRIARYEDQEVRIYDKHGKLAFVDADVSGKDRPEVDRGQLRQMLLDSVPAGAIRWGHALSEIEHDEAAEAFELVFRNGARERFDLVVGADGAWSRVRPLVSQVRPLYSGVMFVELSFADVDFSYPEIASLVGRGLMFALGDSKALIGHRDANAHVTIYAGMRIAENCLETGGIDLAAFFGDWSDGLLQLIYKPGGGEKMTPRPIYVLPVGHRWQHRPGITLLGDAAHLMSPFSGEGANLAMRDAVDLALALGEQNWKTAVQGFEATMFARAEEAAAGAMDAINNVFSEDGLAHLLRLFEGHGGRAGA